MISIHLTKPEARLCRDAAKAENEHGDTLPLVNAGDIELSWPDLNGLADALDCLGVAKVVGGEGRDAAKPYEQLGIRLKDIANQNRPKPKLEEKQEQKPSGQRLLAWT